jgi:hypothetical protein
MVRHRISAQQHGKAVAVSDCGSSCWISGGSSGIALLAPVAADRGVVSYYFRLERANPSDSDQYIGGVGKEFAASLDHFKSIKAKHAWGLKATAPG